MSHKNHRRPIKFRKPVSTRPNKVITPDSIYDRQKIKRHITKMLKGYIDG